MRPAAISKRYREVACSVTATASKTISLIRLAVVPHKGKSRNRLTDSASGGTFVKVTYRQIQASVKETAGFVSRDWIAHVKELNGLRLQRIRSEPLSTRLEPCPPGKRKALEDALRGSGSCPAEVNHEVTREHAYSPRADMDRQSRGFPEFMGG